MKNNNLKTKRSFSGAAAYVVTLQASFLATVPFILVASDTSSVISKHGVLQFLFEAGICSLPRAIALALSSLYRATSGEIWFCLALAAFALVFGLLRSRIFPPEGKSPAVRCVFAALVAADLVVRLLPFSFNRVFGAAPSVVGSVVRLAALGALVYDIIKIKKK